LKFSAEAFKKAQGELWADTLELRPNEDNDPARQFLEQQGLPLKTARGVLNVIRQCWDTPSGGKIQLANPLSGQAIIARCKGVRDGTIIYNIPRFVLLSGAAHARWRSRQPKLRWWHSRKARKPARPKTRKQKIKIRPSS
jgi:hypothetical protein